MSNIRQALLDSRRIVIKLGSSSLPRNATLIEELAKEAKNLRAGGHQLIIVSSGAVAFGFSKLGFPSRPTEVAKQKACASVGQSELMTQYRETFARHGLVTAQILLTHSDLAARRRVNSARETLETLLELGAIPIINENDTVASDEIGFGDNDQLSSMVTPLVDADLLILCTDVEGVLDDNGERIPVLSSDREVGLVKKTGPNVGSGGMGSKIDAARKAARSGAHVVMAQASTPNLISRVSSGEDIGTWVMPHGDTLRARKHWIAYTLRPRGSVLIDSGAANAVLKRGSSLLPVGVVGVSGNFVQGDCVRIISPEGEIGRGLTRMSTPDIARYAGKQSAEIDATFYPSGNSTAIVVHKDDLVHRI